MVAAGSGCRPLRLDLATLELAPLDDRTICDGTPEGGETGVLVSDRPGERGVFGDGGVVLGEAELRSGFRRAPSGHVHPVGADRREDGLLAVVVSAAPRDIRDVLEDAGFDVRDDDDLAAARRELGLTGPFGAMALSGGGSVPQTTLQLWRDGRLEVAYPLRAAAYPFANRRFGELVRFSPDGSELLLGFESPGSPVLLLDVATLRTALRPTLQHGVAWSPDGAYFALSTGSEIRIAGALRSQAAYVLPVAASALAWLPE